MALAHHFPSAIDLSAAQNSRQRESHWVLGHRILKHHFESTKSSPSTINCHDLSWCKLTLPGIVQCFRPYYFKFMIFPTKSTKFRKRLPET